MDPLQIAVIVLVIACVWAVAELAIAIRRARGSLDKIDRATASINDALTEARPVIQKLDGTLDDLQPVIQRAEPLLESANTAMDALSADLVEVEAVIRDVSHFTGAAANAGSNLSAAADTASAAVRRIFRRGASEAPDGSRALEQGAEPPVEAADADGADLPDEAPVNRYYTYGGEAAPEAGIDDKEAEQ